MAEQRLVFVAYLQEQNKKIKTMEAIIKSTIECVNMDMRKEYLLKVLGGSEVDHILGITKDNQSG